MHSMISEHVMID